MNRFPAMIRSVNESLDEIITTFDKMNTIYQSAEQMSPMVKQVAKLLSEKKVAVSGASRMRRGGRGKVKSTYPAPRKRKTPSSRKGRHVWRQIE